MRTLWKCTKQYLTASLVCGLFSGAALATPISGVLNLAGGATVSATMIDFQDVTAEFGNTGSFTALAPLSSGTIANLTGGPTVGATDVTPFVSGFSALDFELDLTYINPSNITDAGTGCTAIASNAAVGNACALPGSPFNLSDQLSGGVLSAVASFGVSGIAINDVTGQRSQFTGTLATQINGTSYEQLLAITNGGGSVNTSFAGSFVVTTVPEPGTIAMLLTGLGMVAVGTLKRRRARQSGPKSL